MASWKSANSDDSEVNLMTGYIIKDKNEDTCCSTVKKKISKIQCFVGVISVYTLTYVTMEMYLVAVITTIEKRFGLKSSQSGLIISIREVASLATAMLFSHLARNTNKPKFLSVMGIIGALGGFLCAVPHFIDDKSLPNTELNKYTPENEQNLCKISSNSTNCSATKDSKSSSSSYTFFIMGSLLMGLTSSAHSALTNTYVDDNSPPKKTAFYLGVITTMKPFGPMFGFLLGSVFLSIPENIQTWEGHIGAWWLGYIVNPFLYLLPSVLLFFFPKSSSGGKKLKQTKHRHLGKTHSEFLVSLRRLLTNPPYLLSMAGGCFSAFVLSGMFPFMPKYVETQFRVSTSVSNMVTGMAGTMLAGIGIFVGGLLSSRLHWGPRKSATILFVANIVFCLSIVLNMFIGCPTENIVGINSKRNTSCSSECACSQDVFQLVCDVADHVTFASPCLAGCMTSPLNQTYTNCACAPSTNVTEGMCSTSCAAIIPYLINLMLGAFFVMMATIPGLTVLLRIVRQEDKTLALGIMSTVVITCSFIPGPVLYGTLIDSACLKWSRTCEGEGACLFYDNKMFRLRLHGFTAAFKFVATLCFAVVAYLLKNDKYIINEIPEEKLGEKEIQVEQLLTAL